MGYKGATARHHPAEKKGRGLSGFSGELADVNPLRMCSRPDAASQPNQAWARCGFGTPEKGEPPAKRKPGLTGRYGDHSTPACLAHTNKSLARISKTAAGVRATKGHQPEGDVGKAKNKHLLPQPQSEEAEINQLC